MKLNRDDIDRVVSQYPSKPVSANDPLKDRLTGIFGDHTFFLDDDGLTIVEPNDSDGGDTETGRVVELASWTNAERTELLPHDREVTDIVIMLGKAA